MSYERERQIKVYKQLPVEKRKLLEEEFKKLKMRYQLTLPGGDSYVENLVQNIANDLMPKYLLSDDEFLGLAHYYFENNY